MNGADECDKSPGKEDKRPARGTNYPVGDCARSKGLIELVKKDFEWYYKERQPPIADLHDRLFRLREIGPLNLTRCVRVLPLVHVVREVYNFPPLARLACQFRYTHKINKPSLP